MANFRTCFLSSCTENKSNELNTLVFLTQKSTYYVIKEVLTLNCCQTNFWEVLGIFMPRMIGTESAQNDVGQCSLIQVEIGLV